MANQAKIDLPSGSEQEVAVTVIPAINGVSMTTIEMAMAKKDVKLHVSAKKQRNALIDAWMGEGRTSANWDKPEAGECTAFYDDLLMVSRSACKSGNSSDGLTVAEKLQFPKGYSIDTVTSDSLNLPEWVTEKNRIGDKSIRASWLSEMTSWKGSTLRSMQLREKKNALILGGPSALAAEKAQLTVNNLGAAVKRDIDAGDAGATLKEGFARIIRTEIERIVEVNKGTTLPAFMVTK